MWNVRPRRELLQRDPRCAATASSARGRSALVCSYRARGRTTGGGTSCGVGRTDGSSGRVAVPSRQDVTGRCSAAAPSPSGARARRKTCVDTACSSFSVSARCYSTPNAGGGPTVPGDPTPPVVTPAHLRDSLGLRGGYVTNVTVNWTVEDPESQILETRGLRRDHARQRHNRHPPLTCYARSDGGETTVTITILGPDKTAPTVTATPARGPDSNGWYNHALSVGFSGTDATSGIDSCVPSQTYSGPDSANASVSGSCRDRAGNTGTQAFNLNYDATAPQVTGAKDAFAAPIMRAGTTTRSRSPLPAPTPPPASTKLNGAGHVLGP